MSADAIPSTPYPDVELALMEFLAPICRTATYLRYITDQGAPNPANLPGIQIRRVRGGADGPITDAPTVLIECYALNTAANPRASQNVAHQVRERMKRMRLGEGGAHHAHTRLESAEMTSGPTSTFLAPDQPLSRTELIYRVNVRD